MNCRTRKTLLSLLPAGALLTTKSQFPLGRSAHPKLIHQQVETPKQVPKSQAVPPTFGQPTYLTHPHLLRKGEVGITVEELKQRRSRLLEIIKTYCSRREVPTKNLLIIIPSSCKKYMTEKIPYVFRQNSDFLYLTGCLEQDSLLVLVVQENKDESIIFVRGRDPQSELWDGPRTGVDQVVELFGVDKALPIREFEAFVDSFLQDNKDCSLWYDYINEIHPRIHSIMQKYLTGVKSKSNTEEVPLKSKVANLTMFSQSDMAIVSDDPVKLRGTDSVAVKILITIPKGWESPKHFIHQLRLFKSPAEQELMKKSCEIGSQAIKQAMRDSRPWDTEAFIQARVDFHCRMSGAEYLAYPPVVAAGDRANIIHYIDNNNVAEDGNLVLMDAGCEYHGYCSDISRTWPISGKFTPPQRTLYEVVHSVQAEVIQFCCQFPTLDEMYFFMMKQLGIRLKESGIILSKTEDVDRHVHAFCPHHVSHYLGMDVHDTGTIVRHIPLQPGMACTIEPGVYINRNNEYANPDYRGLGIRIEDDILMTESGPLVMTASCPKHPDDIENLF